MSDLKNHVLSIVANLEAGFPEEKNCDGEDFSAYDYLQDALDIQYIVNKDAEYLGARVLVAFGGPNIWVNTLTKTVEGAWWGESYNASYHTDALDLDGALEELWACR